MDLELNDLIEAIDILEYISQYTEFFEKNGEYWALSPLKEERTPSFSIRRETNSFYDFSSGIGGNVLTFVRHYHKCSYAKAVEMLKEYLGTDVKIVRKRKLTATNVARQYKKEVAAQKLSKATILPPDHMEHYERNMDKLSAWLDEGISEAALDKFQVRYDGFSDRIVYPIRNIVGEIINVSGRTIDPQWKEKGLRKYTYFKPLGVLDTIYGISENLDSILEKREIILFEGAKSVMIAHSWGVTNTGAILTSHLNPNQVKILLKLGCRIVFALDKEVDVRADYNIRKLKHFVDIEYLEDKNNFLEAKDSPVDKGKEVFEKLYAERRRYR